MIDKQVPDMAAALADIGDGASVLVGGFGAVGQPNALIDALALSGVRGLTVIANNAGFEPQTGLGKLIGSGAVSKLICSFPRGSTAFDARYEKGEIELEVVPQGTLAERITPTGAGTRLAEGKETRNIGGRDHVLEYALGADVALIQAYTADRWGNLTYKGSGRNFNPIMAMAGKLTIAQVASVVPLGELDPNVIVTPGIFVNRVLTAAGGDPPLATTSASKEGAR
jgi:3-oxoadipate CoA-transferase, alpha subunit